MYNGVYTIEQYAYMHDTLIKWLKIKLDGVNLGDKLLERGIDKVAVYGANELGEMVGRDILKCTKVKLAKFVDQNKNLRGQDRCGVEIISPEEALELPECCYILVVPEYYFKDILDNLICIGIPIERIISLSMIVA